MLANSILNQFDVKQQILTLSSTNQTENNLFTERRPTINEKIDNEILVKFHKIYGNKWKEISNRLSLNSDSFIKNMFYTLARKALRKVNVYIELDSKLKNRKVKLFKLNFVFKLANLAESERISDSKQYFDSLKGFYTKLLYNLLDIGKIEAQELKNLFNTSMLNEEQDNLKKNLDSLIESLRLIEKIFIEQNLIKKGRTKKKFPKKGLVQKAYSSKAFKNILDDSQTKSLLSLSTIHFRQHKSEQNYLSDFDDFENFCEIKTFAEPHQQIKNQLDTCLQLKTFDPILFE